MKRLLTILCFALFTITLSAQSTVAKIKYEQAEEAYNNNDFKQSLVKLEEVEKLLAAVNPKIMYLRIMAQKALVEKGNYSYGLLDSLRKSTDFYIKSYETNTAVEDKFREVYLLSEQLAKYPQTRSEYDVLAAEWKRKEDKQRAEAADLATAKLRAVQFIDSLVKEYGFIKCSTLEEFKKYNKKAASVLTRPYGTSMYIRPYTPFSNNFKEGPISVHFYQHNNESVVDSFTIIVEEVKGKNGKKEALNKWKEIVYANIPAEFVDLNLKSDVYLFGRITVKETQYLPIGIRISVCSLVRDYVELTFSYSCYEENSPSKN